MWGMIALTAVQFGMQVYGITEQAKQTKEMAELRKEDVSLQKESLRLNEEARKLQEDLAEAKVRKDMRSAQAKMLVQSTVSGVDKSSVYTAMSESMVAQAESGLAVQKELAGIQTGQAGIQEQRLGVASSMIQSPSDLDTMLNIAGAGIGAATQGYMAYKYRAKPKLETEVVDFNVQYDTPIGMPLSNGGTGRIS